MCVPARHDGAVPRKYELKARAEKQAETRRRIVDAAFSLHVTIGPAATTVAQIAATAGVERLTVYRHFPEQRQLFQACAAHGLTLHPLPDPARWNGDLAVGLAESYAYYRANEQMMAAILRDREGGMQVGTRFADYMERAAASIAAGLPGRFKVRAAIAHVFDFNVWRSLARQGLDDGEAVELMTALVESAATREAAAAQTP
jgi:AcrR family transcriptional regulator